MSMLIGARSVPERALSVMCQADNVETYYTIAATSMFVCWLILSLGQTGDFHRRNYQVPIATRPSALPAPFLLSWLNPRRAPRLFMVLCHGAPVSLALAAVAPQNLATRALAAVVMTLYQCAETSLTHSHRDFANMYVSWMLVLAPSLARGAALGVSIVMLAGSGYSKYHVGGLAGWSHHGTLRSVLRTYGKLSLQQGGPALPALNTLMVHRDNGLVGLMSVTLGAATLLFELGVVPLAIVAPRSARTAVALASVALHAGIAMSQSLLIGVAFLPNVAVYVLGLCSCSATGTEPYIGDTDWWLAVFICATWFGCIAARRGRLLPEDWPCTPFALFAWNSSQWEAMFNMFQRGCTRLVLTTSSSTLAEPEQLVGQAVVGGYELADVDGSSGAPVAVYDGYEQCFGETLVHEPLLPALLRVLESQGDESRRALVRVVAAWLARERRLIEVASGQPIARAAWVELDDERKKIARVLYHADGVEQMKAHVNDGSLTG